MMFSFLRRKPEPPNEARAMMFRESEAFTARMECAMNADELADIAREMDNTEFDSVTRCFMAAFLKVTFERISKPWMND